MRLIVYKDKSTLETDSGAEDFLEGAQSPGAKKRIKKVKNALEKGFLEDLISEEIAGPTDSYEMAPEVSKPIYVLVDSVTSEVGRALVGLAIMQLCIKAISPDQSIRLHKGGSGGGTLFSWKEGISMRTLDKSYITPTLRKHNLLSLNADGFMMTRSLAENYPYSGLYKAALRGAKGSWLDIVESLESNALDPLPGLRYMISLLVNRSNSFKSLSNECLMAVREFAESVTNKDQIMLLLKDYIKNSEYSARLFEIALHSAFQVIDDEGGLSGSLKPLSQMRSANKKHGNIGDIEVLNKLGGRIILEAWDTKFGKPELREELEELSEKLGDHPDCGVAGFITDQLPVISDEIKSRKADIEVLHDVNIEILKFEDFVLENVARRSDDELAFFKAWLITFAECICQRRREFAPIDEPCDSWVRGLIGALPSP